MALLRALCAFGESEKLSVASTQSNARAAVCFVVRTRHLLVRAKQHFIKPRLTLHHDLQIQ